MNNNHDNNDNEVDAKKVWESACLSLGFDYGVRKENTEQYNLVKAKFQQLMEQYQTPQIQLWNQIKKDLNIQNATKGSQDYKKVKQEYDKRIEAHNNKVLKNLTSKN
jgi:hypothetical protein